MATEILRAARSVPLLIGAGLLCIAVQVSQVGLTRLHLRGMGRTLNDQVVYVDAARHLRSDGELTTGVIYPSTLRQEYSRNYMYMPGHAVMTSLFFLVFGDSPASALSVNILAYIACIVMIYLIGRRIGSSRIGVVAALLFAVFPIVIIYACTAMAEMTLLFVCLAALAVFAHLRDGVRVWLAPVLLTVPFLFRETAALWIIPMAAVDWELGDFDLRTGLKRSLTMAMLSFIVLSGIFSSRWISDRPSLIRQNLFGVTLADKYLNAFSVPQEALSVSEWARVSLHHAARNLSELEGLLVHQSGSLESVTLASLLLAFSVLPFVAHSRMRPMRIALLCLGFALFALLAFVYRLVTYIGVRHLLLVLPLAVILAASTLDRLHARLGTHLAAVSALIALALVGLITYGPSVADGDDVVDQLTATAGQIEAGNDGTLVASAELGLLYVYLRPMSSWALTPWNRETLELLHRRFGVSAAVLSSSEEERLGAGELDSVGLHLKGNLAVLDRTYHMFVDRRTGASLERAELLLQKLSTTTPQDTVPRHLASLAAANPENPRRKPEVHEVSSRLPARSQSQTNLPDNVGNRVRPCAPETLFLAAQPRVGHRPSSREAGGRPATADTPRRLCRSPSTSSS